MDKINWYTPENKDGMTIEEVINAVIQRLSLYNAEVPCTDNINALSSLDDALVYLRRRTEDRIARGVEGTMKA